MSNAICGVLVLSGTFSVSCSLVPLGPLFPVFCFLHLNPREVRYGE